MHNKKNEKTVKLIITIVVVALLLWFLVLSPIIKFKKMEKILLDSAKRYFEVNENLLPTGNRLRKISLQTLYDKDYIKDDLKAPYTNSLCDTNNSWVKVSKSDNGYDYSGYLECGIFRSKIDHEGPVIKLNGSDEITIYKDDKYKELGVESVYDNTDGKISKNKVTIDSSKVNTNKVGTYEVTYSAKDSLENETIKKRIVKVTQTLNNIVKKNTDKTNYYKGSNTDNYLKIDGITFKIVGINSDKTVKVVSNEALANIDYNSVDEWLNNYFYEKLSDTAKNYIVKSKWCNSTVSDSKANTKCNDYTKSQFVGLLAIEDYNKSYDENNVSNLNNNVAVWTYNRKNNQEAWINSYYDGVTRDFSEYKNASRKTIVGVKPALNIKADSIIVDGTGSNIDPYILKENKTTLKAGSKISDAVTGSYINYSGYNFRVISKESDGTVKVIMLESLKTQNANFYSEFDNTEGLYNPNKKANIGYKINNKLTEYIKTNYFDSKTINIKNYTNLVSYTNKAASKEYKAKLSLASLFDLYSAHIESGVSTWYQESSKKENYINSPTIGVVAIKFSKDEVNGVKLVGYLNKNVVVKSGNGTENKPYTLTK